MVSLVDAFLVAGVVAGCVLCWFGYRVSQLSPRLGRRSFVAFIVTLGVGCLVTGLAGMVPSVLAVDSGGLTWTQLPVLFWLVSTLPWFVFALQYTGTRTQISVRTVAAVGLPYSLIIMQIGLSAFDVNSVVLGALGSAAFIYIIALVVGGSYLLLRTTRAFGHVSLGQGVSLVFVSLGTLAVWNVMGMAAETARVTLAGAYFVGAGIAAAGVGVALLRYDLFGSTPSVGTLGEQALTRETDDLMFVVDDDDRLITINETAVEATDSTRSDALGGALADVVGADTDELRQVETVAIQTTAGTRQYDPQVSPVTDHHDNVIGATVSLRDVTERELREQRLAVLNRVLRHNLRNEVDVVKSHAEALEEEDDEHVGAIVDAADGIATLGRQARRIDQYVSEPSEHEAIDIGKAVDAALEAVGDRDGEVAVTVDIPASATVVTNRRAVSSALRSALDNAVAYADSTVEVSVERRDQNCTIEVSDDGPGIPDWELESLDTGTESPLEHSTGLGLWQLKWAVTTLNGELSFDTEDGTTVSILVHDRGSDKPETP